MCNDHAAPETQPDPDAHELILQRAARAMYIADGFNAHIWDDENGGQWSEYMKRTGTREHYRKLAAAAFRIFAGHEEDSEPGREDAEDPGEQEAAE